MTLPVFEEHLVTTVDGVTLAAQTWGAGDTTIVIANGLGGTLIAWTPLLRAFEHTIRFISWDYRGLYGSSRPTNLEQLAVADHVRDMRAVMDHFGVNRAVVAGWSMGVQVCIQAAADLGDRVQGVVLINGTYGKVFETAFTLPGSRHALPILNKLAIKAAPLLPSAVKHVTRRSWFLPLIEQIGLVDQRLDREVFLAIAQGFDRLDFEVYHLIMDQLNQHDGAGALDAIDVPLLMIAGDKDAMTPASVRHVIHQRVRHAQSHVIPGGTHYTLLEYPDAVIARIEQWLNEHAETFDAQ